MARANFIGGLEFLAQARVRFAVRCSRSSPVRDAALELYTGGLWSIADLEVLANRRASLTAELFALGFRFGLSVRDIGARPVAS